MRATAVNSAPHAREHMEAVGGEPRGGGPADAGGRARHDGERERFM